MKKTKIAAVMMSALLSTGCILEPVQTAKAEEEESRALTAFELYDALHENEVVPYELNDKAADFLTEYDELFPCENLEDIDTELIDDSITKRQIQKNDSKFGDKLFVLPSVYVLQILEEEIYEGDYITEVNVIDEEGDQYYIIYYGELTDVYEDDTVSVVGLPLGNSSFENTDGGQTLVIVIAGSYIELAE